MNDALGLVEIQGLSTAIEVADTMVKAANVSIIEIENTRGLGYITVKIQGDVGAVNAAVSAGAQTGIQYGKLISKKVIPRPSTGMAAVFCEPKGKTESKPAAKPKTQTKPKPKAEPKPEGKAEVKPEVKPEVKVEPKVEEAKPEVKVEPKVEEAKQEVKTEPKPAGTSKPRGSRNRNKKNEK